jgi:hypothetical protein
LVENYLQKLTNEAKGKKQKREVTPMVKSLSGIIDLPTDYDHKKDYSDYLINSYCDLKHKKSRFKRDFLFLRKTFFYQTFQFFYQGIFVTPTVLVFQFVEIT